MRLYDPICGFSGITFVRTEILLGQFRRRSDTVSQNGIQLGHVMPIGSGYD